MFVVVPTPVFKDMHVVWHWHDTDTYMW